MDFQVGLLDRLWTAKMASCKLWTSKCGSRGRFGPPSEPLWAPRRGQEHPRVAQEPLWNAQGSPNGSPESSNGFQKALQRLSKSTRSKKAKLQKHSFYLGKIKVFQGLGALRRPSESLRKAFGPPSWALRPALDRQDGILEALGLQVELQRALRAAK